MYIKGTYIQPSIIIAFVPPSIIRQPVGGTIKEGNNFTLSVQVVGSPPFTYKWYKNNVSIANGGDNSDLIITNAGLNDDAYYYCKISNNSSKNSYTTNSDTVKLNVLVAPVIVTQPTSINTNPNTTINFTTSAIGSTPITYNWYKENTLVSSSVNNSYYIFNTQKTNSGNYHCVISNLIGSVTSNTVQLTVNEPLAIVTLPSNFALNPAQTLNTSLSCTGTTPITAQWRKDGVNCKPSTVYNTGSIPLLINNIQLTNDGSYDCVLTNIVGVLTSASFYVYVNRPISITTQPNTNITKNINESCIISFINDGTEPISYRWFKNDIDTGIETNKLTINNLEITDAGVYKCTLTNVVGSVTTDSCVLTVNSTYLKTKNDEFIIFKDNSYWRLK